MGARTGGEEKDELAGLSLGPDLGTPQENGKAAGTKSRTEWGRGKREKERRETSAERDTERETERGRERDRQTDIRCRTGDWSLVMLWPGLLKWEEKAEGTDMPSRVLSMKLPGASSQHYLLPSTLPLTRA